MRAPESPVPTSSTQHAVRRRGRSVVPLGGAWACVRPTRRTTPRSSPKRPNSVELGRQGRCTPRVERSYPLERIAEAHADSEGGPTRGKIVVRV
ncbi:zinc-binding dehydrogenase [Streptomyces sp. NPDC091279]|uniref:zinc-binding dehydrogenase n=1 Tax=Streptomyces sp. NPDC091279 TaxID=3365983 RepID=UPI00381131A3